MPARDRILIRDLLARGIIGVEAWERETPQDILLNLTLFHDLEAAGRSDEMADSINYRTVAEAVLRHVETGRPLLVEALAESLARLLVLEHRAERVIVRVEKPGALPAARSVGVEIERCRDDFA